MNQQVVVFPLIPEKRYFSIGEAASLCLVKPHVLRFWEKEFSQLQPSKRQGRRYYCHDDIELIRQIRELLYVQGYTISGAKSRLLEGRSLAYQVGSDQLKSNVSVKLALQRILQTLN